MMVASTEQTSHVPAHWDEQLQAAPVGKRRVMQSYCEVLTQINSLEPAMRQLSDAELSAQTSMFRQRLAGGATLDSLLPEAFATVREVARRVLGMRHFDSQMVGGMVLHDGQIAEMATGEGKTLVATLPAYLNALTGYNVHIVTVNDYLAARDAEWMGKVYAYLGLTCGAVSANMTTSQYKKAYACDITYVTGQELGFAYLRDNTASSEYEMMLPAKLQYAIVDEADSILIDESRNPMIISLPVSHNEPAVRLVDKVVRPIWTAVHAQSQEVAAQERQALLERYRGRLDEARMQAIERRVREVADAYKGLVIKVDQKTRSIFLSPDGAADVLQGLVDEGVVFRAAAAEGRAPTVTDMFEDAGRWGQLAITAFKAYELHTRGKQYIVKDGKVIIVDEHTGRLRDITRWQEGLHQAVEAKEGVEIKQESQPTATITFQIFFRYYGKLAGMTGTAAPAAAELFELYGLKVVTVPTNKPRKRKDLPCRFYFDPEQRAAALCSIVERACTSGRPVLIGTTSVQESERVLSQLLMGTSAGWSPEHEARIQVLNATPEKVRQESKIVAQAGLPGSVTIATNMAGRGTDIILGGSPEGLTKMALLQLVLRHLMSAEEVALLAPLPAQLLSGPLGLLDTDDLQQALQGSNNPDSPRLPLPVYAALTAAMLLATTEAEAQREQGGGRATRGGKAGRQRRALSYDAAQALLRWAMDIAYTIRREAYDRIKDTFGDYPMEQLEFVTCVTPVLADVLAERESLLLSAPQGQQFMAKAAVYLWAWLDRECAQWGADVRAAGGLLVVGTSVQESRRIELQLRGRAGRQGDPGMTVFLYDITDPYMSIFNVNGIFNVVQQLDKSNNQVGTYVDGGLVDTLVSGTQRSLESAHSNARLEMKRYDQVVEEYRTSVYTLRRLILLGSLQQRTQVLYMFIQFWVDEAVAKLLGSGLTPPTQWLQPSIPDSSLPPAARTASRNRARSGAGAHSKGSTTAPNSEMDQAGGSVSPLEALLLQLDGLVNPGGHASRPAWDFASLRDGIASSAGVRSVLSLAGVLQPAGGHRRPLAAPGGADDPSTAGGISSRPSLLTLPLDHQPVALLTPQQMAELASFITGEPLGTDAAMPPSQASVQEPGQAEQGAQARPRRRGLLGRLQRGIAQLMGAPLEAPALPWPAPPGYTPTPKQVLVLSTHARLYGFHQTPGGLLATSPAPPVPSQTSTSQSPYAAAAASAQLSGEQLGPSGSNDALPCQGHSLLPDEDLLGPWAAYELQAGKGLGRAQRPALQGKHADMVAVVRNYLGVVLIQALEARRLEAAQHLLSCDGARLDLDAQHQVAVNERDVMLLWLDAFWSVFLEEVESLRKAVALKSFGNSNPLDEFRLEANRAFLSMLATYREAVVAKVLVPDVSVTVPLDNSTHSVSLPIQQSSDSEVVTATPPSARNAADSTAQQGTGQAQPDGPELGEADGAGLVTPGIELMAGARSLRSGTRPAANAKQ